MDETVARIAIPGKLIPVFDGPADVRGAHGGRGSAKTRSFALMTAVWGYRFGNAGRSGIIVCGRQFMNSLADSSFDEVAYAIRENDWLASYYDIGEKYIRSKDGRISYAFSGLDRNIASLKSKARILLCWVDEAEPVTESAWATLIPTIREEESELWVTWNPDRVDSPVETRFRNANDPLFKIVELNWSDNKMFPERLQRERLRCQSRDMDEYLHVWEGGYKSNSEARVFKNWVIEEFEAPKGAIFRLGADWGFAVDPTVLVRCHIDGKRLYIDYEAYMVGCEIDQTPDLFDQVPDARKWFITADSARPETISYLKRHGYPKITPAAKGAGSIEDGIEFLKSYDIVVHPRCEHTIDELTNYSYKIDPLTGKVLPVLKDKKNHVIDAIRYGCEGVRKATRNNHDHLPVMQSWAPVESSMGMMG